MRAANILNLRATPSLTRDGRRHDDAGTIELTADGRSSDGDMAARPDAIRATAWVFASLVTVNEGDDASDALSSLDSPITQPMQSMTLESCADTCGGGLLVQAANSADGASRSQRRAADVLDGDAAAASAGRRSAQRAGHQRQRRCCGERRNGRGQNGRSAASRSSARRHRRARTAAIAIAFASLVSAPLDLLPQDALACVAGVTSGTAPLYRAPGADSRAGELDADSQRDRHRADDDRRRHNVVSGRHRTGCAGVDVQTAGVCDAVPQVSPTAAQQRMSQPAGRLPASPTICFPTGARSGRRIPAPIT